MFHNTDEHGRSRHDFTALRDDSHFGGGHEDDVPPPRPASPTVHHQSGPFAAGSTQADYAARGARIAEQLRAFTRETTSRGLAARLDSIARDFAVDGLEGDMLRAAYPKSMFINIALDKRNSTPGAWGRDTSLAYGRMLVRAAMRSCLCALGCDCKLAFTSRPCMYCFTSEHTCPGSIRAQTKPIVIATKKNADNRVRTALETTLRRRVVRGSTHATACSPTMAQSTPRKWGRCWS